MSKVPLFYGLLNGPSLKRMLLGLFLLSSYAQASEDSFYDHVMRALGAKTDVVVLAKIEDPLLRARVKHRDQVIRQRRDIQIQFAEDRRLDHDLLKPLNKLIEDLEGQRALVEYYEQYRRDLLTLPLADLFRPEIQCFGRHPFLVEERCIRDVILKDVYGKNLRREGQAGHHTVSNFGGIHFKVNGHPPLRPGLEQAMYGFHKRAFGGGIVSSRLLWVKNVHVKRFNVDVIRKKRADDPERAEFEILKELYGEFRGNEEAFFEKYPHIESTLFPEGGEDYVIQASQTVVGKRFDEFLKDVVEGLDTLDRINRESFQRLFLGSLLTLPGDGKGDNYMITEGGEIIGIDNDDAFATPLTESRGLHYLGVKTVLWCLRPLMEDPITIGFDSPAMILWDWLEFLEHQNRLYEQMGIPEEHDLGVPLKLKPGTVEHLYTKCWKIKDAPAGITASGLLSHLYPEVAEVYRVAGDIMVEGYEKVYGAIHNATIEDILGRPVDYGPIARIDATQTIDEALHILMETIEWGREPKEVLERYVDSRFVSPKPFDQAFLERMIDERANVQTMSYLLSREGDRRGLLHRLFEQEDPSLEVGTLFRDLLETDDAILTLVMERMGRCGGPRLMSPRPMGPFEWLVQNGAYQVEGPKALEFYKSHPSEVWDILEAKNPELSWKIGLYNLFKEGFTLRDETGVIRRADVPGRHLVTRLIRGQRTFYFKFNPEFPGIEEAVGTLTRRVIGFGAPYTEVISYEGTPVLISSGIQGETLKDVILRGREVRLEGLHQMMLMAILINPEDGKGDNYMVEPFMTNDGEVKHRLVGIDNERAFVPAISENKKKIQVKTILYLFPQMLEEITEDVKRLFIAQNVQTLLREWLLFLEERTLGIPFRRGALEHLYTKFIRLQNCLQEEGITPLDVLKRLEPDLGLRYEPHLRSSLPLYEKFRRADGALYGVGDTTVSLAVDVLKTYGEVITPREALRELEVIEKTLRHKTIESIEETTPDAHVEHILDLLKGEELTVQDHKDLFFDKLKGRCLRRIVLRRSQYFEDKLLKKFLGNLTLLDLTGSHLVTHSLLEALEGSKVQVLKLEGVRGLKKVAYVPFFGEDRALKLPELRSLDLSHIETLETVLIEAPHLRWLSLEGSPIQRVSGRAPELKDYFLENVRIKHESLLYFYEIMSDPALPQEVNAVISVLRDERDIGHLRDLGIRNLYGWGIKEVLEGTAHLSEEEWAYLKGKDVRGSNARDILRKIEAIRRAK